MTYYISLPGDLKGKSYRFDNSDLSMLTLGDVSFDSFYPHDGFDALYNILIKEPKLVDLVVIIDDHGNKLDVESFLQIVETLTIKLK